MTDTTKATLVSKLSNREKLTPDEVKALALTPDEVKAFNAELKTRKAEYKLECFHAKNCIITVNGKELAFNPRKIDGKDIIVWKNADGNGYLLAQADKEGKVSLTLIPRVSDKSKNYEYKQILVSKTKKTVIGLFEQVTKGLDFSVFMDKCKTFDKFTEIAPTGILKKF